MSGNGEYACNNNAPRAIAVKAWQVVWPFAGLSAAVLVNVLWIGALGYALVRLLMGPIGAGPTLLAMIWTKKTSTRVDAHCA